ncbi:MarR family transcriptional regulator [Henriciella aquimarina]|uniref:MarR family transcriptional regulator n=1 Tax=Henriciella aquimarina TaxID=545261 RepID=UPI0009FFEFA3|nr:MarR family transcriptional regulator [Henriciella aquimarina]
MAMNERQSLDLWRRTMSAYVRTSDCDLSARQQAIFLTVALEPGPHTVRGLAASFDLAKPAVTRALDTLEKQGFVRRRKDENDLRSVFIERTVEGMDWLRGFAQLIMLAADGKDVAVPAVTTKPQAAA